MLNYFHFINSHNIMKMHIESVKLLINLLYFMLINILFTLIKIIL